MPPVFQGGDDISSKHIDDEPWETKLSLVNLRITEYNSVAPKTHWRQRHEHSRLWPGIRCSALADRGRRSALQLVQLVVYR